MSKGKRQRVREREREVDREGGIERINAHGALVQEAGKSENGEKWGVGAEQASLWGGREGELPATFPSVNQVLLLPLLLQSKGERERERERKGERRLKER